MTLADLAGKVRDTILTNRLLVAQQPVVVGVSGGPDSLCLLDVLRRLSRDLGVSIHVAHLDHGARGSDSMVDAEFVGKTALEWDLPCTIERQDVTATAEAHRLAFEEAARRIRYSFLARVAMSIGATRIAVGHNADDQAETVLMHLLRGAGPAGLRGMLYLTPVADYRMLAPFLQDCNVNVAIVRPLLDVSRASIEGYCRERGLHPRFDRSNLDQTFFRNRIRHELLPLMEEYNPRIRQRLRNTAAISAADCEVLADLRARTWNAAVRSQAPDSVAFDLSVWRAMPVALQRDTIRQAALALRKTLRDVNFVHVENARRVALEGTTGSRATLPKGMELSVGYDTIVVGNAGQPHSGKPDEPLLWTEAPIPVSIPGSTRLPGVPWALYSEVIESRECSEIDSNLNPWLAYADMEAITGPVTLRTRRPGDRFQPHGMWGHSMRLSEFMINRKIPRQWRRHRPLLVAGQEIIWVCGERIAETVSVNTTTRRIVKMRFVRNSG